MMSLWDALRMNMMISYQELVRTFPRNFGSYECYVSNLNKRCPKCHAILDENDYSYPTISCITDWCGWQPEEKYAGLHSSELQQKIYTEIDRRVHSGEYKLR